MPSTLYAWTGLALCLLSLAVLVAKVVQSFLRFVRLTKFANKGESNAPR